MNLRRTIQVLMGVAVLAIALLATAVLRLAYSCEKQPEFARSHASEMPKAYALLAHAMARFVRATPRVTKSVQDASRFASGSATSIITSPRAATVCAKKVTSVRCVRATAWCEHRTQSLAESEATCTSSVASSADDASAAEAAESSARHDPEGDGAGGPGVRMLKVIPIDETTW